MGRLKERNAVLGRSQLKKQSIVVRDHPTSVSLEQPFWDSLKEIAATMNMPASELVTTIDSTREHANLSSAIRLFVLSYYRERTKRNSVVTDG